MQEVTPIESPINKNRPIVIHDLQQEIDHRNISEVQMNDNLSVSTDGSDPLD